MAVERLDELIQRFESHPDASVQGQVIELLRCVDTLHRAGLQRVAELLGAAGLLRRAMDDPEARLLFELYELDEPVEAEKPPAPQPGSFVPLDHLIPPRLVWRSVMAVAQLEAGRVHAAEIGGERVLLANVEGEVRAYRDACPGTPLPLRGGPIEAEVLICPWHRCRFDLRTGERIGGAGAGLEPVPVRVESGEVRVGVRERAAA